MRNLLLVALLFFNFNLVGAEPCAPLTFVDLIDIALENNPETKAVWWKAKRAEAHEGVAKSAYYPSLGIETSATHGREFRYINGPDVNYTNLSADLVLGWMLYDFGERQANLDAARWALMAADWQYNFTMQKVILDVLSSGYRVLHASESLEAAQLSSKEAGFMLEVAKELHAAGLSPISDVDSLEASYAGMQIQMLEQRHLLDVEKAKLATLLGMSAFEKLELEKINHVPQAFCQAQDALLEQALERRADFAAKQAEVLEAKSLERKVASENKPKLFFAAKGGGDRAFQDRANGLHYGIALNFDIPLFDGFENIYKLQARRADVLITEEELLALNLEISLEILKYSNQMQTLQQMYVFADRYLQSSEKAYLGKLEMYKAGQERSYEVSAALTALAQARIVFSDIKTRWLSSSAYLAFSTGTLLLEDLCY